MNSAARTNARRVRFAAAAGLALLGGIAACTDVTVSPNGFSSEAEYVSFFDDDDWPADDFVPAIMKVLKDQRPDYVGFQVHFTEDGVEQVPVYHSLAHGGWANNSDALLRDIVHFNPIKRELAVQGRWEGGAAADVRWADQLRSKGIVKSEVYLDRVMHHYRHTGGCFTIPAAMVIDIPPQPDVDWVTWLTTT